MSTLSGSSAIYLQIQKHFETEIAAGRMAPGSKIDSIRALAVTYKVNPNTIQKSLQELERSGLIYTDRTNGKFVTEDKVIIKELNVKLAKSLIASFFRNVSTSSFLGQEKSAIISFAPSSPIVFTNSLNDI